MNFLAKIVKMEFAAPGDVWRPRDFHKPLDLLKIPVTLGPALQRPQ